MKRNITLDYYRVILSILIVFAHFFLSVSFDPQYTQYMGNFEYGIMWEISELAKIVVPTFFLISGFYLNATDRVKTYKFLIRVIKMYVVWTLFYFPWNYFLSLKDLLILLLTGFYHLWYLVALIEAIIFIFLLRKIIKKDKFLLGIAIFLFFCGYIIQLSVPYNNGFNISLYRNAIFYALPFVIIGNVLKNAIKKFNYKINMFHVVLGVLIILIEGYIYLIPKLNYDVFISAIVVAPLILIYVFQIGKTEKTENKDISHIASGIYFIHPAMLMVNSKILPHEANIVFYQFPFMIITTVFVTFLIMYVNKTVKIFL